MQELARQISEIIQCYRKDDIDGIFYNIEMTPEHVINWVSQFDENDRDFLLSELLHILPSSYFSKDYISERLRKGLEKISTSLGYEDVYDFFSETEIICRQDSHKSQNELLCLVNEIIREMFQKDIRDIPLNNVKYWLYIDDLLASGGTFKKDVINEIGSYNLTKDFENSNIKIICLFIGLHDLGWSNTLYSLDKTFGWDISKCIKGYRHLSIQNNVKDCDSKLNIAYPKESEEGLDFLDFIENSFVRNYPMRNKGIAFRPSNLPVKEEFYSSSQARDRYENILLKKGIELIHNIQTLTVESIRPLGMTNPSNKTLGTGSHFFTWRNISNTCPIVFWWEANGWYPLFPVKNRGY